MAADVGEMVSTREIAARLGKTTAAVSQMVYRGALPEPTKHVAGIGRGRGLKLWDAAVIEPFLPPKGKSVWLVLSARADELARDIRRLAQEEAKAAAKAG